METVAQQPVDAELDLLTRWGEPGDRPRRRYAGALSVLLHVAAITGLMLIPGEWLQPPALEKPRAPVVTPLIAPLTELTQPEPNNGKINKEFSMAESHPRPRIQIPAGPPSTTRPQAFQPAPLPPVATPPPLPLPDPPKIEQAAGRPALPPQLAQPAIPQIQPVEKPRMVLENVTPPPQIEPGTGRPLPRTTADAALQGALHGGLGVGDPQMGGPGGFGAAEDLPPSPGMQPNNMQLLSDPMGVDFRPYLSKVLANVKRYWLAIWPESARMGRSGKVAIQFSIDNRGGVPKLVIASTSGIDSLDRAAVAAISGSVPFPPLPHDFKGNLIKLQLNFAYNMPK